MRQLVLLGVLVVVLIGSGVAFFIMNREQSDPDVTAPTQNREDAPVPPEGGDSPASTTENPAPVPVLPPAGGNPTPKAVTHPPLVIDKGVYHPRLGLLPENAAAAPAVVPPAMDPVRQQEKAKERDRRSREEQEKARKAREKEKADIVKAVGDLEESQGDKLLGIMKEVHQVAYQRFVDLRRKGSPTTQKEVLANVRWEYYQKLDKFLRPHQIEAFCKWWDELTGLPADPSKR